MGIIMRVSALALGPQTLTWVLFPLNQLSSILDAGWTGRCMLMLTASLPPLNIAFPPKEVLVRLLLKLPSRSLASGPAWEPNEIMQSDEDILSIVVCGVKEFMIYVHILFLYHNLNNFIFLYFYSFIVLYFLNV